MKRSVLIAALVAFWAVMMAWLIRYEAFPGRFGGAFSGYREMFSRGLMVMDQWTVISFKNKPIGYSHTQVDLDEQSVSEKIVMNDQTILRMKLMEQSQVVHITSRAALDAMHHLQTFRFILSARGYSISFMGTRLKGNQFTVNMRTAGAEKVLTVEIPEDAVIYSPMTEMAIQQLEPGQQTRIRTFNPASMTTSEVLVRALRRETLRIGGKEQSATCLATEFQGMEFMTWIDRNGQLLRQETPLGWTIEASTAEQALKVDLSGPDEAEDLVTALAVPCLTPVRKPRECRRLRLFLRGPGLAETALASDRQRILQKGDQGVEYLLTADAAIEIASTNAGLSAESKREFLAPSPFLQSDNQELILKAREITASCTNQLAAAVAIYDWVYHHVAKVPTISLPSALDVLHDLRGDCNEHTYLFVGLARAAGLPAKIMVGLVYNEEAFYYHAWPAVYVGRWLEMDPTFGQPGVDATHLALIEGELPNQLKLMGMLGRLQVEVLSEE